ncbi:MAG: VWA domain-containing protein [Candidatus Hydrogenedentes bacterium]|nr:VWA domain-containing protein [Candidatus Hydrogenedentota bacterium]
MSNWWDHLPLLNTFGMRFAYPWALLLLALVPYTIYLGRRVRTLSQSRKWISIALRCLVLLCLIAALAGAELIRFNDKLAVFFLLDQSDSVPAARRAEAERAVQTLCDAYMTSKDEAGVIVFGEYPSIELAVGPKPALESVQSEVGGEQTDLAAALRLAIAASPQGYMRRIVAFTDGNETHGSVMEEIKLANAIGASVDFVPLDIGGQSEVRIAEVSAPNRVNASEPFKVQVTVHADQDCEATLRLYQKVKDGTVMLPPAQVHLQKGENAFLLPQELVTPGFYEYEAVVESASDTVTANNEGRAFTVIYGQPKVLYLEADPEHSARLGEALAAEGLQVDRADFGSMPTTLAQMQNYDALVLSNVSATDLSSDQLKSFEVMVRDMGIGLVMVGGPDTFGAGGYFETPVERALPVSMDLKQRRVMPQGALVLVLDKSGSMSGEKVQLAKAAAIASVKLLSEQDYVGVVAFDSEPYWVVDVQEARNRSAIIRAIEGIGPGGGTDIYPALVQGYDALLRATASLRHIVLLTDGQSQGGDYPAVLQAMNEASITVSTVAIGDGADVQLLQAIAGSGNGRFYYTQNPYDVPQILTKEAAVVKKGMLIEKQFTPQVQYDSEILRGLSSDAMPDLLGYVATTPKDNAIVSLVSHEGDPVLAQWRYGLGKSVAYTSDVTTRWAPRWLEWDGFGRFWSQAVRWSMRETSPSNFRVETSIKDGKGYLKIDAVNDQGQYVNFLKPKGVVTGPPPDFARQDIAIAQTAPGIYEGTFPLGNRGVYMINMTYTREDGSQGMIPAGLALNYSKEYEHNTTNLPLLERLAAVGGGRVAKPTDNPFEHNLPKQRSIMPIWPYLAAAGACLFPVEIFVRRVVFNVASVFAWAIALLRRLPGLARVIPQPTQKRTQLTGAYGTMTAPSTSFVYVASGTFSLEGQEAVAAMHTPVNAPVADGGGVTVTADEMKAKGRSDYTRQLLEAKDRALDKRKRKR